MIGLLLFDSEAKVAPSCFTLTLNIISYSSRARKTNNRLAFLEKQFTKATISFNPGVFRKKNTLSRLGLKLDNFSHGIDFLKRNFSAKAFLLLSLNVVFVVK